MAQDQRDVSLWAMADLATPMAIRVVATLHPAGSSLAIVELRSI